MNFFTTCLHSGLLCCCCPLRTKEDGSSLEVALQKLAKALRARIAEHLLRRPLFLDTTLVEKHRLARDLAGEAHLVGHPDHGAAFLGQLTDHPQHLAYQLEIGRASWRKRVGQNV